MFLYINNTIESPPTAELELAKIKSIAAVMVAIVIKAKRDLKFNPVIGLNPPKMEVN